MDTDLSITVWAGCDPTNEGKLLRTAFRRSSQAHDAFRRSSQAQVAAALSYFHPAARTELEEHQQQECVTRCTSGEVYLPTCAPQPQEWAQ
eukprot:5106793-Amphidinium_carterae.2